MGIRFAIWRWGFQGEKNDPREKKRKSIAIGSRNGFGWEIHTAKYDEIESRKYERGAPGGFRDSEKQEDVIYIWAITRL